MSEYRTKYNFSNDLSGTHMLIVNEVAPSSKVLDIGCASGYLGGFLAKHKNCKVWGVEPSTNSAQIKPEGYEYVASKTLDEALIDSSLSINKYDFIILADVLEHLLHPEEALLKLKTWLAAGGKILISLPNIAHYSIRRELLLGRWNMTDTGILDRTHLHFYTLKTARNLIEQGGFKIEKMRPRGDLERWGRKINLEKIGKRILFAWPELFGIQFIFVARL